jgi:hypothetical protein
MLFTALSKAFFLRPTKHARGLFEATDLTLFFYRPSIYARKVITSAVHASAHDYAQISRIESAANTNPMQKPRQPRCKDYTLTSH